METNKQNNTDSYVCDNGNGSVDISSLKDEEEILVDIKVQWTIERDSRFLCLRTEKYANTWTVVHGVRRFTKEEYTFKEICKLG